MTDSQTAPDVSIIGAMCVDDIAKPAQNLHTRASNPVSWKRAVGGVATNVARVVARHQSTQLIFPTGDDDTADACIKALNHDRLQLTQLVQAGHSTSRYTAVLDHKGELFIGLADVSQAELLDWREIRGHFPDVAPAYIVVDANLSEHCIADLLHGQAELYAVPPKTVALAVSPVKAVRLAKAAAHIDVLFCNRAEAVALTACDPRAGLPQLGDKLLERGFTGFVLTDGSNPLLVQQGKDRAEISIPAVTSMKSVNGAGDALAGATIAALCDAFSLADAVEQYGIPAAMDVLGGRWTPPSLV